MPVTLSRRERPHARFYSHWLYLPAYRTLSSHAFRLLMELLARYRPDRPNLFRVANTDVSRMCGCSRNSARRYVDELEERGWIRIERRGAFTGQRTSRPRAVSLSSFRTETRPAQPQLFETWTPAL